MKIQNPEKVLLLSIIFIIITLENPTVTLAEEKSNSSIHLEQRINTLEKQLKILTDATVSLRKAIELRFSGVLLSFIGGFLVGFGETQDNYSMMTFGKICIFAGGITTTILVPIYEEFIVARKFDKLQKQIQSTSKQK
ncbi:hypothetical protein DRP07_08425 [Archaeoglobales archaeon]|nr:MAG: hypothetical protein DRP07_08425 [Archaeoglobales archaeon]